MIKVLVVEDDPMVAHLNKKYIEKLHGFETIGWARNGKEAYEYIKRSAPDLLLLDVYMPVMDGLALLEKIREEQIGVDVILVTSAQDTASIDRILQLGAVDYLIKPFEFERFEIAFETYKVRYDKIKRQEQLTQEDLDEITGLKKVSIKEEFHKGIDKSTMAQIKEFLMKQDDYISTQEIGNHLNISRVTIRKYLEYMQKENDVEVQTNYGGVGRPLNLYKIRKK